MVNLARANLPTLKKTASYYVVHVLVASLVAYAVTGNLMLAITLATSDADIFALGDCAQYAGGRWADGPVAGGRTLPYVMPIMSAAKVLAAQLAGRAGVLDFPLMPVSVKTPALPLVVASPALASVGQWHGPEEGRWHFIDDSGLARGFALAGKQTSRRTEQAQRIAV